MVIYSREQAAFPIITYTPRELIAFEKMAALNRLEFLYRTFNTPITFCERNF